MRVEIILAFEEPIDEFQGNVNGKQHLVLSFES